MEADWPTIAVMVAIGGLLWRQIATLTVRVDALGLQMTDVDRRLARLEGWIEGERAGRVRSESATVSTEMQQ
jgi:hypothetical protein